MVSIISLYARPTLGKLRKHNRLESNTRKRNKEREREQAVENVYIVVRAISSATLEVNFVFYRDRLNGS